MALPIADTPTLYGKEARRIRIMLDNVQYVGDEEVKELKEFYERIKRECKFEL